MWRTVMPALRALLCACLFCVAAGGRSVVAQGSHRANQLHNQLHIPATMRPAPTRPAPAHFRGWNPAHTVRAIVLTNKPKRYGTGESRIDLRDKRGRGLASADYCGGGTQGYRVYKIAWTANSRFLVFSLLSSGGHSPWHTPTHFYDAQTRMFYSVDALVKGLAVTDAEFRLRAPATLRVVGRNNRTSALHLSALTAAQRHAAQTKEHALRRALRLETAPACWPKFAL